MFWSVWPALGTGTFRIVNTHVLKSSSGDKVWKYSCGYALGLAQGKTNKYNKKSCRNVMKVVPGCVSSRKVWGLMLRRLYV